MTNNKKQHKSIKSKKSIRNNKKKRRKKIHHHNCRPLNNKFQLILPKRRVSNKTTTSTASKTSNPSSTIFAGELAKTNLSLASVKNLFINLV